MSFFKNLFRKKYPKNKIDTNDDPIDVYAGPEPDEPCEPDEPGEPVAAERPDPEQIRKPVFGHVYAGPKRKKNNRRQRFEAVYAGPRRIRKKAEPMECVYAGPEYFAKKDDTELLVICEKCGAENKFGAETCEKCGEKL